MAFFRTITAVVAVGLAAGHAAALAIRSITDTGAAPAGFVSNDITVDTDLDILSAEILIELDTGTLYNPNPLSPTLETFQQSPGDTYVTIGGNPNTGIAGGAGDFGHNPIVPGAEFGPTTLGVTYFDTSHDDIGIGLPMGTFSFSNDAMGSGQLSIAQAGGTLAYIPFAITNGAFPAMFQDPLPEIPPLPPPPQPAPPQLPPAPPGAPLAFFQTVPQSVVPGISVNDLVANTDTDWTNASVLIELTQGSVYNDPGFGGDLSQPALWSFVPSLEYDTAVGVIGDSTTTITGGADDITGGGFFSMSGQRIDVSYTNGGTLDTGTFVIGRFSLTADASGWVTVLVDGYTTTIPIYSGFIGGFIPEPASLTLLGLASSALLRRSRA
jgi:hypothetical protein